MEYTISGLPLMPAALSGWVTGDRYLIGFLLALELWGTTHQDTHWAA